MNDTDEAQTTTDTDETDSTDSIDSTGSTGSTGSIDVDFIIGDSTIGGFSV